MAAQRIGHALREKQTQTTPTCFASFTMTRVPALPCQPRAWEFRVRSPGGSERWGHQDYSRCCGDLWVREASAGVKEFA